MRRGELGRRQRKDHVGRDRQGVRDEHGLPQPDHEAPNTVREGGHPDEAVLDLPGQVAVAKDWACDQHRKKQQIECS